MFDRDWNGKPQFPELAVYLDILKRQTRVKYPPSAKPLMSEHHLECAGSPHHRSSGWGNSEVISTHKFNDQNFCLLAAGLALLPEPMHVVCFCWWHILNAKCCINKNHCASWLGAQGKELPGALGCWRAQPGLVLIAFFQPKPAEVGM